MPKYVALLRGINVGGHRKILMKDLKEWMLAIGFENIQTYIQSGNLIFESSLKDVQKLAQLIKEKIALESSFDVPCIVVESKKYCQLVSENPLLQNSEFDKAFIHVTFLTETPSKELVDPLMQNDWSPEAISIQENLVFIYAPNGYLASKLQNTFIEKSLKSASSTRNWKTTCKLVDLLSK